MQIDEFGESLVNLLAPFFGVRIWIDCFQNAFDVFGSCNYKQIICNAKGIQDQVGKKDICN